MSTVFMEGVHYIENTWANLYKRHLIHLIIYIFPRWFLGWSNPCKLFVQVPRVYTFLCVPFDHYHLMWILNCVHYYPCKYIKSFLVTLLYFSINNSLLCAYMFQRRLGDPASSCSLVEPVATAVRLENTSSTSRLSFSMSSTSKAFHWFSSVLVYSKWYSWLTFMAMIFHTH